jgi:hypothetical protein
MIHSCTRIAGISLISFALIAGGCRSSDSEQVILVDREPVIEPDYAGVTIPPNIAQMNFKILEEGGSYVIHLSCPDGSSEEFRSSNGQVRFPRRKWKNALQSSRGGALELEILSKDQEGKTRKYRPVRMSVAATPVDPYLCYRLLYPGYESWVEMQIMIRSTERFRERPLADNRILDLNCINCHSFVRNNPDRFLVHMRGSRGGTYFYDGKKITRTSLRTGSMKANAVYPAWHPGGRFVAFSSNRTVQTFHMMPGRNIEVTDLYSSLVIYDTRENGISGWAEQDSVIYMETFPCWSPDGRYLYYCRTPQVKADFNIITVQYDLVRRPFDTLSGAPGTAEVIFNARELNQSVSFPSISPDGNYLVFTLHDYGTFPIWHREADLYIMDLNTGKVEKMTVNSDESDSYHSWSSEGRWLVFSSKRSDGLTARPYLAYFESPDSVGKPFVLPQRDPTLYRRLEKTFNRPEFVSGKIHIGPRDFMRASKKTAVEAIWTGSE